MCTCFNLRKTARIVTQHFDEALRDLGIRITQFTLLVHVYSGEKLNITRLSDLMLMDRTTLARNLNPLVKKNLLEVRRGEDKRTRYVLITDLGIETLEKALPAWKKKQDSILSKMGNQNWDSIRSGLNSLLENLE